MKIVIEGMDGAGKSTVAKEVARRLGFKYVDSLLSDYLREEGMTEEEVAAVRKAIDLCSDNENSELRTWFYGYANLFNLSHYDCDLVIDRHCLTTYYYNGDEDSQWLYKIMQMIAGKPDLVIILRASKETRIKRLLGRNKNDRDLKSEMKLVYGYDRMEEASRFLELNYKTVDTDDKDVSQVTEEVLRLIGGLNGGDVLADDRKLQSEM